MYKRSIKLVQSPSESFFLWGPRQTGKSALLRTVYPGAIRIDLLKTDEFVKYHSQPWLLREELAHCSPGELIILDEIQKVPALLDEVHGLIEEKGLHFGLCGSSARKLKRGHANLLGGRAGRFELHGLVSEEVGKDFDLLHFLSRGYLPRMFKSQESSATRWKSYVADYLKEEILAEGLIRNLPVFTQFLNLAALADTEQLSYATFSRDCGVAATTVKGYFDLLVDTLIGRYVYPFQKRAKRRVVSSPKFYFFDVGLVNSLAKRREISPGSPSFGKAFENWVYHEIQAYVDYRQLDLSWTFWRLSSGIEVDFVSDSGHILIEAKGSEKIHTDHLKGIREFKSEYPKLAQRSVIVSLVSRSRQTEDGISILSVSDFIKKLWADELVRD